MCAFAVVDSKDGKVYDAPFQVLAWAAYTSNPALRAMTREMLDQSRSD
jgi:hypothetical protein